MDPEEPESPTVTFSELVDTLVGKLTGWLEAIVANLPNMVIALLIVLFGWFVSKWVARLVKNALDRVSDNKQLSSLIGAVCRAGVLAAALFIALGVLQLDKTVTSLLAGVGILGIALGFAVQDLAANLVSGTIMAIRRPFRTGDLVETNGFVAVVTDVDLRATHFRLLTGEALTLPNKEIFNSAIINRSRNGTRRIDLEVGVAYGDDLEKAAAAIAGAIVDIPHQTERDVEVFWTGFGSSSIDATVRFWISATTQAQWMHSRSEAIVRIKRALDDSGCTIPFPIRTLDFGVVGGERLDEIVPGLKNATFGQAERSPDSHSESSAPPAQDVGASARDVP